MKIALHVDGPTIRGNEKQVIAVARELCRRGHEVVASCRASGPVREALHASGIRTTGVRPRGDLDAWHAARFALWLRRERPDAVLLTSWVRDFVGAYAARAARVPRIVLRIGIAQRIPPGIRGWTHRHALRRGVDAIVVNSFALAEYFRRVEPRAKAIVVAPNGIYVQRGGPSTIREEFAIPDSAVIMAGVGGLERRKGFDILISALASLRDKDVHIVLAGDGAERNNLRALAQSLQVADQVHMPGQRTDIPGILAAADGFVLSSRNESLSVALLEAMAAGKAVIATDVIGSEEALAPREGRGPAGWIVPRGDAAALATALRAVSDDLRSGGAEAARRATEAEWRVANWFTVERMVDAVEAALWPGLRS